MMQPNQSNPIQSNPPTVCLLACLLGLSLMLAARFEVRQQEPRRTKTERVQVNGNGNGNGNNQRVSGVGKAPKVDGKTRKVVDRVGDSRLRAGVSIQFRTTCRSCLASLRTCSTGPVLYYTALYCVLLRCSVLYRAARIDA